MTTEQHPLRESKPKDGYQDQKLPSLTEADLNMTDALQDDEYRQYLPALLGTALLAIVGIVLALFYISASTIATLIIIGSSVVLTRHVWLSRKKLRDRASIWASTNGSSTSPNTGELPAVYHTYILGSGGHTGEIFEFVKRSFRGHKNLHRRYIITSGDTHSPHIVARLETLIRDTAGDQATGTWDVVRVARARKVHQPLWTAWYTSIISALSIVNALVKEPKIRPKDTYGTAYRYPHVIVTNGPGTGFIVCLVAYILKLLFIAPSNRMKMVYMETWAHISTLSLTGKLFYYTDIADMFLVQHMQLADRVQKPYLQLFQAPNFAKTAEAAKG
ncbi:hypothetical protein MCOR25_004484 [Pyricularia grisea]|uniref:UDP-N-acetylglucosamine transferase subunit ALG14 n=1 Tax=Pyricularia grisea TaxID=148305 RepID=A0A6P8B245_PYRGI|nr:uncharacterized protein PgNI_07001 [Pyricularia grisea]KAI6369129.1 hypothetical protein MCOR25_004484 [Pyricularia grisea]TLD08921.1 hypothetical protein PgNI_07001 [Pyricularia grisea]